MNEPTGLARCVGDMRKSLVLVAVLLLAVASLHPVAAAPLQAPSEIHGTVAAVDYSSGKLVVRVGKNSTTVEVSPSTQIYLHGRSASLAEVHRGSIVSIRASNFGGRIIAQIIRMP